MRITIDKLHQSKKHPILLDAAKYLNQEAYNKFHKSYIDRIYYLLSIELHGSINIPRDESIEQPRKFGERHCRCTCKEATGFSRQCVHEIVLLNKFEPTYFDIRWKARDMVTCCHDVGTYQNPKMTDHLEKNDVQRLSTSETMIESYDEINNVSKENDECIKDVLT